jgi:methionyl-tRNA formyltransferase
MGLKILLLACRATGREAVKRIAASKHKLVALASQDFAGQVDDDVSASDFAALAENCGAVSWTDGKLSSPETLEAIRALSPDIGLSVGWRRLVKEPLISIPRLGFYNFHTSDLPRYRGFASTSWAILRGDARVGVCAHEMRSGKADEGDIFLRKSIDVSGSRDIGDLFRDAPATVADMVVELLDGLEDGSLRGVPQDESEAILSFPRRPSDGWIDWTRGAVEIDRLVRSVARPYPGAFTCWNMRKLTVWKGHVDHAFPAFAGVPGHVARINDDLTADVLTGDGVYSIEELQLEGDAAPRRPGELLKGSQQRLGLSSGELFEIITSLKAGFAR